MIRALHGNLLESQSEALVNAINCMGVMGKGIALQFKMAYPDVFEDYRRACADGRVLIGRMHVYERTTSTNPRYIINFPTKRHWKEKSRLIDIRDGLSDLVRVINELKISSISLPALGCGNGALDWTDVGLMIREALGVLEETDISLYEPDGLPAKTQPAD